MLFLRIEEAKEPITTPQNIKNLLVDIQQLNRFTLSIDVYQIICIWKSYWYVRVFTYTWTAHSTCAVKTFHKP